MDKKLDRSIKELVESSKSIETEIPKALEGKFTSVEGKIREISTSLEGKIRSVEGKISETSTSLGGKITSVEGKMNDLNQKLDAILNLISK